MSEERQYPDAPGHHGEDTSVAAAESVRQSALVDSDRVANLFMHNRDRGFTADEVAGVLRWPDVYRARRRVTELKQQGILIDTGERRKTKSGRYAAVLKIKPKEGQQEMF